MAKGLHAQLSCHLPDKPEIIDAGDIAELVFYRAVLRCREYLTDGVIDRRVAARWFAGIRGRPATHLDRLVSVGLLEPHASGWCFPDRVWREWCDNRQEFNRRRWHVYCRRHEVFARDGGACVRCGDTERLEVDHIIPMVRGGTDDDWNLQTLCKSCNSAKRDR